MTEKNALEQLRGHIDEIDDRLLDLLNRRAGYAGKIAAVKKKRLA